ncbi:hypothetical protein PV327_007501, partial [Microctonus hyperodae]
MKRNCRHESAVVRARTEGKEEEKHQDDGSAYSSFNAGIEGITKNELFSFSLLKKTLKMVDISVCPSL